MLELKPEYRRVKLIIMRVVASSTDYIMDDEPHQSMCNFNPKNERTAKYEVQEGTA